MIETQSRRSASPTGLALHHSGEEMRMHIHTKGPWTIGVSHDGFRTVSDGTKTICTVGPVDLFPQIEADARLIAAAPELLSALEVLAKAIDLSPLNVSKDLALLNAHAYALTILDDMHIHTATTSRQMPYGGVVLSICSCGARRLADDRPITGGVRDVAGWYGQAPASDRRAYDLLQSEGHEEGPEPHEMADAFDAPGAQ